MAVWPQGKNNVWKEAMDAPFDWDFEANKEILCLSESEKTDKTQSLRIGESQTVTSTQQELESLFPSTQQLWHQLMPATAEVKSLVESVMSQIGSDEKLLGVHFRSQWLGGHFACGCKDPKEIAQCAGSMGSFLAQRDLSGWNSTKIRMFVASDQPNGLLAFERAFGKENILQLPSKMPIEHSLSSSKEGAVRVYADWLILSQSDAMLGTCGSTFTGTANLVSNRPSGLSLETGTETTKQCASMAPQSLDVSGFIMENFAGTNNHACDCYAPEDQRGGTCMFQCRAPPAQRLASKCPATPPVGFARAEVNEEVPWHQVKQFI